MGVARASMVGCTFGGFIALNQAAMTPERVARVVAISPPGVFGAPIIRLARRLSGKKRAPSMTDLVRRPPRDATWARLMAVTMAERPEVSVINPPVFARAELRAIRAPALLLIGAEETLYDPAATLRLAQARMPQLAAAIVPDADHIAAMAQPEDVDARILQFLQEGGQASA